MGLPQTLFFSLVLLASPVLATFDRDVAQGANRRADIARSKKQVNDELLSKAIPLEEYEKSMGKQDLSEHRKLEDFQVDYDDMYSFSGYSLRYARCQPVQYFSENAVLAGEYSPMITEDIVVLRLCPQSTCSTSSAYGCYYNYAEYAITLNNYVKIMLRYTSKMRDYTCEWCNECRQNNNNQNRQLEDANEEAQESGDYQWNDDAYYSCSGYNDYCYTYNCDDEGDDTYLDYDEYLDYIDCVQVEYNDYAYFVRPRCNGSTGTFKMEVYYDSYCIQYAGNDVTVKNLGLGFQEGMFENYYSKNCIDCSEASAPPYFDASSTLCNMIHSNSAKCTDDLMYDLFENEEDDSGECTFIESIRFGAYDENGNFASDSSSGGSSWNAQVTIAQKAVLGVAVGICVIFVVYSCYLHHAMTNLLIKSLSHRELLPPSRSGNRRSSPKTMRRNSKRSKADDEPDWDSGHTEATLT